MNTIKENNKQISDIEHSPFAPSSLNILMACSGSYKLCKDIPSNTNDAALEGIMLHEKVVSKDLTGLNEEQKEKVQEALEFIEYLKELYSPTKILYEHTLELMNDDFDIITFGTPDIIMLCGDTAILCDMKFGYSRVEHTGINYQLGAYACMIAQKYGVDSVIAYIFQPRISSNATSYTFKHFDTITRNIENGIRYCKGNSMVLNVGTQCTFCKAKDSCPAYTLSIKETLAKQDTESNFKLLSNKDKELEYDKVKLAVKYLKKYKEFIVNSIKTDIEDGKTIGNFNLKRGRKTKKLHTSEKLYNTVSKLINREEYESTLNSNFTELQKLVVKKLVDIYKAKGLKITSTMCKLEFMELIKDCITINIGESQLVK